MAQQSEIMRNMAKEYIILRKKVMEEGLYKMKLERKCGNRKRK